MRIVIVGCGASGIISAIACKTQNNEVIILEKEAIPLKKILKTGNGRCNYFNDYQGLECYHSSNQELIKDIITNNNLEEVKKFFESIGIVPKIRDGYYYPNSNQASSIRNALLLKALEIGVKIEVNLFVTKIKNDEGKFIIYDKQNKIIADKVIISTGSYASFRDKCLVNGYNLLKELGHTIRPILPSLVQLKGEGNYLKDWKGIRCDAKISLYINNKFIKEEEGELQLTDYGISGICTFNISGRVSEGLYNKEEVYVSIDFLPAVNNVLKFLEERISALANRTCLDFFEGVINTKLIKVLFDKIQIDIDKKINSLDNLEKQKICNIIKDFRLKIIDTNPFSSAQVAVGGIPLEEINVKTMESLKIDNLYITGEVLDIDGICGGYNLTYCWISGLLAGRSIKDDKD